MSSCKDHLLMVTHLLQVLLHSTQCHHNRSSSQCGPAAQNRPDLSDTNSYRCPISKHMRKTANRGLLKINEHHSSTNLLFSITFMLFGPAKTALDRFLQEL